MRIISGFHKGTKLYSVPGLKTRPTTDFLKEAMFSIIFDCKDCIVLDLFAGSGSLGLEALSRGASFVDFVDFSDMSYRVIEKNMHKLKCIDNIFIYKKKVSSFLNVASKKYDLIFMDPPYSKKLINITLSQILQADIMNEDSRIVIEHSISENNFNEWKDKILTQKKYGDSMITVLGD